MISVSELYEIFLQHPVVTTDSRNCPEGSLFFALKGDTFNGNVFAESAIEKGCAYAIVDEPQVAKNEHFIVVNNVLEMLQQLAKFHRQTLDIPVVGITGTNGKTTTKELIAAVLAEKFEVHFTQGNFNNHIGVPLTLLGLRADHQIAVIEMGANHPGEIAELVEIVQPNVGLITNVGKAHLQGFGSLEGVLKTKGALYDFLRKTGGKVFVNNRNELLMSILGDLQHQTYALDGDADVQGRVTDCSPFVTLEWHTRSKEMHTIRTKFVGIYNAENVLAAASVGLHFGVSELQICHALETYMPQNNRSQFTQTADNQLIVDAYNANPTSMQAALENFAVVSLPNKVAILGDMLELGDASIEEHRKIVELLQKMAFGAVFLVGKIFTEIASDTFNTFENVDQLAEFLTANPLKNHAILIKGSNGIRLTKILQLL